MPQKTVRQNLPRPVHESDEVADKDRVTAILVGCMYYYLFHALFKGEHLSREEVAKIFHDKSAMFNKACSGKDVLEVIRRKKM